MGASAGAIGRFNVGKGAQKRGPAFGTKCGRKDLFSRVRLVPYEVARLCCVVQTDLQHAEVASSAVACDAIYC